MRREEAANHLARRVVPFLMLAMALLPGPALLALHFRGGPPARVTAGFGEDSCHACHFGNAIDDADGRLALVGLPERYTPGETYELELTLSRPQLTVAGFELAVRHAGDSTQAGRISPPAQDQSAVGLLDERGVQFAHHALAAAPRPGGDAVSWKLRWTAPDTATPIVVHASALAGDGDDSQLGDYVYTLEATAVPDEPASP